MRRSGDGRSVGVLAAMLVAASLLTLVPGFANAHDWEKRGINGARLKVSPDGYTTNLMGAGSLHVIGEQFKASNLASIFQCEAGAEALLTECQPLGAEDTDASGKFTADVAVSFVFQKPNGEFTGCASQGSTTVQCAVVAATFDPLTGAPNSKAEHYICFEGTAHCKPGPTDPPDESTTTSSSTTTSTSTSTTTTTSSTTTSTSTSTTTTTTTLPPSTPPECRLREHVVAHEYNLTNYDPATGGPGNGQDSAWQQVRPAVSPENREGHAMAYDPVRKQTVLFGGFRRSASSNCVLADTWIWDGTNWTKQSPTSSPPARYAHAMAFDGKQVVLLGGYDGHRDLADTWTWDGTNWTRHETPPLLTPRARAAMAYNAGDPSTAGDDEAVLFGGEQAVEGRPVLLADTWTWSGADEQWRLRFPISGPMPRAYAAMASYPAARGVVLHGGWNGQLLNGTFVWNGTTWRQTNGGREFHGSADPANPPETHSGAMAYHPETGLVVLRAGNGGQLDSAPPVTGSGTPGEDGVWNGTGWTVGDHSGPPHRSFAVMAEDANGHLVFFGGFGKASADDGRANPELISEDPSQCLRDDAHKVTDPVDGGFIQPFEDYLGTEVPDPEIPEPVPNLCLQNATDLTLSGNSDRGDTWTLTTQAGGGTAPVIDADERLTVAVDKEEIPSDGKATATVTATVTRSGIGQPGYLVEFTTPGDVVLSPPSTNTDKDGRATTTVTASKTPGSETIEVTIRRPAYGTSLDDYQDFVLDDTPRGSTMILESGMTLSLDPPSIPPDGSSRSVATATAYKAGLVDEEVCFSTDGDVAFAGPGPDHCGSQTGPGKWAVTIIASQTPGIETITATGKVSGLSASAELAEGGGAWFDRSPSDAGPSPGRENAAMAYDEDDHLTVLFGGYYGDTWRDTVPLDPPKVLGDTWLWDGTTWSQVMTETGEPVLGPSAREGAAMAYDASSGDVLLFGGHDGSDYLADTWTLDVKTRRWTRHDVPGPSKRYVANMAGDGSGVVLFSGTGGFAYDNPNGPTDPNGPGRLHDTWTWRNGVWTEEHPELAPPPAAAAPRRQFTNPEAIVLPLPPPPPGCPGTTCPPDRADPYPSPISVSGLSGKVADVRVTLHGLTYTQTGPVDADVMLVAPDGKAVMVMSDACGDGDIVTPVDLTLDDRAPSALPAAGPCPSGTYRPIDVETAEVTPFHRADAFPAPAPGGANDSALGTLRGVDPNGTWSLYVVDDGPGDPNPVGEAGRVGGGWTIEITTTDEAVAPPPVVTSPPNRGRAAMAYHPPSGKVVVYGGTQEYQAHVHQVYGPTTGEDPFRPLGDTWTWDPAAKTWTQEGTGASPGARRSAAMGYHAASGQLVVFGGSPSIMGRVADPAAFPNNLNGEAKPLYEWPSDTWTWDGGAWTRQTPPISPPGAFPAGAAIDPRGRVVFVAGLGSTGSTWTWEPKVSVTLSPRVLPADGTSTTLATARVTDAEGHPIPGLAVAFRTDGDVRFGPVTDRGDGTYVTTITASTTGGLESVTARTPLGSATATLNEVETAVCSPAAPTSTPGTWTAGTIAEIPDPRTGLAASTGADGRIYTFGGYFSGYHAATSTVSAYDPCANVWKALPPMPGGDRSWAAAATGQDGRVYVMGGQRANGWISMDVVEVYSPGLGKTPGRWNTLAPLPVARSYLGIGVDPQGDLYVTGGLLSTNAGFGNNILDTVDVYSPTTGRWRPAAPMSQTRDHHASAVGPDGRIFAVGGRSGQGFQPSNSAEAYAYNPSSGQWERVAPMLMARGFFGMATGPDGLLYAAGGGAHQALVTTAFAGPGAETVEAYIECADAWVPVAPMHTQRSGHATVTGPDGRIYVISGQAAPAGTEDPRSLATNDGDPSPTPLVEAYTVDPATTATVCPRVIVDDVTVAEDLVGAVTARFTVTLDRPRLDPATVDYQTVDGSAEAGSDFVAARGTLTFEPGEVSKTVEVTVNGDATPEADETFRLVLSASPAMLTLAKAEGTATIVDAPLPSLSVGNATVAEMFSGSVPAVFTVSLSETARVPVAMDYTTADGTAAAGADYTPVSGRVEIPAGASSAMVSVPVLGDTVAEDTEEFSVQLSNPTGASLAAAWATGTILDAVGGVSVGDSSTSEGGTASFTVTMAGPAFGAVAVDYATSDGTARGGSDYTPASGTLRFEPGEMARTVAVEVADDGDVEELEKFTLVLTNPSGAPLTRASGTGTIVDDDIATDVPPSGTSPSPDSLGLSPSPSSPPSSPVPPVAAALLPAPGLALLQPSSSASAETPSQSRLVVPPPAPPQPVPNPLSQAQAQQQGQQQAQQQVQQQTQTQAQQQAQQQAQAQASAQVGMMSERQREHQTEQAHAAARDAAAQTHLASSRHRTPRAPAPVLVWFAALMSAGMLVAFRRERTPVASRVQS